MCGGWAGRARALRETLYRSAHAKGVCNVEEALRRAQPFGLAGINNKVGAPLLRPVQGRGPRTPAVTLLRGPILIRTHPVSTFCYASMGLSVITESSSHMRDDDMFVQEHFGTSGEHLRIDSRRLMSKLLHVLNVRPRINSGMAVRAALTTQFEHT